MTNFQPESGSRSAFHKNFETFFCSLTDQSVCIIEISPDHHLVIDINVHYDISYIRQDSYKRNIYRDIKELY